MHPDLTFDEETHTYRFEGRKVPSVTTVIAPLSQYLTQIPRDVLEEKRLLGKYVHQASELADIGDLDWDTLWGPARPYVEAWRQFVADTGFTAVVDGIEARLYHMKFRYAGTADRIGILGGQAAVLDLKTSETLEPAYGVQLAAYQEAWNEANPKAKITMRKAVQLRPDGTYRVETYRGADDFSVFLSCLTLYHWKEKYGRS